MAHTAEQDFCIFVKNTFPEYFVGKRVLDVGSWDVNGNNRFLFTDCEYTGLDAGPGKNIDIVCLAHEYAAPDGAYDLVISTEMLEHDMKWDLSLKNMLRLVKPDGLLLITCAAPGREEHGTTKFGHWHPCSDVGPEWADYYHNISAEEFKLALDPDKHFSKYFLYTNSSPCDLYFAGFKL